MRYVLMELASLVFALGTVSIASYRSRRRAYDIVQSIRLRRSPSRRAYEAAASALPVLVIEVHGTLTQDACESLRAEIQRSVRRGF